MSYFNPIINLPAFAIGAFTANLYLHLKNRSLSTFECKYGGLLTSFSMVSLLIGFYLFYFRLTPYYSWMGRTASLLLVPFVAIVIFCLTRYTRSFLTQTISHPILTKLGEASYSIYLLHAFFGWYPRDFYYLGLNPWLLFVIAMAFILVISRLSYLLFERPVQKWLRTRLLTNIEDHIKMHNLPSFESPS